MLELTVFKNRYDNKTHRRIELDNFDAFSDLLYKLHQRPSTKEKAPLISPAVYKPNTTRANDNVRYWGGWAALDIDDKLGVEGEDIYEFVRNRYGSWCYTLYSTASSRHSYPKFRLVFPTKRRVKAKELRHFWFTLNTEFDSLGDKQVKDFSRMYYVPANYVGAFNFFDTNSGNALCPDRLMRQHPYVEPNPQSFLDRLPEEMREQVIEHRKAQLNNTDIRWNDYRDCPFFPKRLAAEYVTITDTGWYHHLYRMMVSIATKAIQKGYPITAKEIETLIRQFDIDHGNWYSKRPILKEANRALEFAYRKA